MPKKTSIGGQAVIEGIMMKGPQKTALAVRIPDGSIDIEYIEEKHLRDKWKFFGLPILRGCVNFIESMVIGYKALMKSADKSGFTDLEEEEEARKKAEKAAKKAKKKGDTVSTPPTQEKSQKEKKTEIEKITAVIMIVASILGVILSVFLFMYLPALLFDSLNRLMSEALTHFKVLFEGIVKMIIFFVYVALVSKMKDIKRVFQYHGAEHKTIFCYEAGLELSVENVKKQSRFHPRCGTSFMILMLTVGVLLGVALTQIFPSLQQSDYRVLWVITKILILPITCGIGYELLKICGRHDNVITRIVAAPGMWMQRLTTKEPDDSMMELAIESLKAVLPENEGEDNW